MASPRHLLQLEGLGRDILEQLFARARILAARVSPVPTLAGHAVAQLFFESSTRTRLSFERAGKALGADVLNLTSVGSSVTKGESLVDTALNVEAMGVRALVIRHAASGAAELVSRHVSSAAVVNAGDGSHEHPSQGLLDAFTLTERLGTLAGKRIVIAGDVLHSRVARSNAHGLRTLGAQVIFSGPPTLIPAAAAEALGVTVETDFDRALEGADGVMMLRVQLERQKESMFPSTSEYARHWGLNAARAARLSTGVPVLHPGPINRGVELASDVAEGAHSAIPDQVKNGVAVRMAILEWCCG